MIKNDLNLLKKLVEKSKKILIVSHARPDPDAISSTTFFNSLLRNNFPDKEIKANIEGEITDKFSFLKEVKLVSTSKVLEVLSNFKPDFIFMIDCMNWGRVSLIDSEKIKEEIKKIESKLIILDHHEEVNIEECDLYINIGTGSTTEMIYEIFVKELKLKTYEDYYTVAMTGLVADTGLFRYRVKNTARTFSNAAELVAEGADIEGISNMLNRLSEAQMKTLAEMSNNFVCGSDYNYSYLSTKFLEDNKKGLTPSAIDDVYHYFIDSRLRSTGNAQWGFFIFNEFNRQGELKKGLQKYKGSFRAVQGINTLAFAMHLNGGGHKSAAGFTVEAKDDQEAIQMVKDVIEKYKEEAYSNE